MRSLIPFALWLLFCVEPAYADTYRWTPATGSVAGYDVYVDGSLVGFTPWPAFAVELVDGQTVTVQARDAEGNLGPMSDASVPHDSAAIAERAAVARADYDGDCAITGRDVGEFAKAFNVGVVPGCGP